MILSISVENFRSISGKEELSFVADRFKGHEEVLHHSRSVKPGILPVLVIYGANASGKTSFLKAIDFFVDAVKDSHNRWRPNAAIAVAPHFFNSDNPSRFEVEFLMDEQDYRYGFSATKSGITSEWLFSGKSVLYERSNNDFKFGSKFRGSKAIKVQTRPTALFLSTAAQNNHPFLSPIAEWISHWDCIIDPNRFKQLAFASAVLRTPDTRKFVESAMRVIDDQITSILPFDSNDESSMNELPENLRPMLKQLDAYSKTIFTHSNTLGQQADLTIEDESRGTQTYFHLIGPVISSLVSGRPTFIDEMDASLHPSLLRAIVTLFQSPKTNPLGSQLIFNTHDTTLLTPDLFRPDQVWFAEKDENEGSHFYPLSDFDGIRSDTRMQRAYLEGRFGALPFIDRLMDVFVTELERLEVFSNSAK